MCVSSNLGDLEVDIINLHICIYVCSCSIGFRDRMVSTDILHEFLWCLNYNYPRETCLKKPIIPESFENLTCPTVEPNNWQLSCNACQYTRYMIYVISRTAFERKVVYSVYAYIIVLMRVILSCHFADTNLNRLQLKLMIDTRYQRPRVSEYALKYLLVRSHQIL